jgi:hypothetical protein
MGVVILTTGAASDDEDMFSSKLAVLLSGHLEWSKNNNEDEEGLT